MADIIPTSFKSESMDGTHDAADTYKIALFTSAASFSAATTAYSTTNEVVGTGYSAGGATLSGRAVTTSGTKALLDFADPSWATSTITARYAMIYNSSKSNKTLYIMDFGSDKTSSGGTFAITFPVADASNALLRFN